PKHGVSPGGAPPRYSNAERLAAMMSVHGHAIWSDPELAGLKLKLLPLADALKVLSSDEGPGATSRRLRAIAMLLAYSWKTRRFTDEIAQLRGNVPHIETALNQQPGRLLLPSIERNPAWLVPTFQNLVVEGLRGSNTDAACQPSEPTIDPCEASIRVDVPEVVLPNGPSFVLGTTVSVISPLNQVEKALDPRQWAQCSLLWT